MPESAVRRPSLLSSEDWVSCWLGFALIALALIGVQPNLPGFAWDSASPAVVFATENLVSSLVLGTLFVALAAVGLLLMGGRLGAFALGFPAVFLLGWLSQFAAGNAAMKATGITYVITGLLIGLFISNVLSVPRWMREAVRTEYYIKTGLVILGSNILIGEILQAGMLGIAQAVLVILAIWYVCFWIAQKMRVDDEFSAILATAVSICGGVSRHCGLRRGAR